MTRGLLVAVHANNNNNNNTKLPSQLGGKYSLPILHPLDTYGACGASPTVRETFSKNLREIDAPGRPIA